MYFHRFVYLVHEVHFGYREGSDPGEDDEGHGVEPGADVGEAPQAQAELDGVDHVVHEEESAQLRRGDGQLLRQGLGHVLEVLRGDGHRHSRYLLIKIKYINGDYFVFFIKQRKNRQQNNSLLARCP